MSSSRIVIVDDDPIMAKVMRVIFEDEGYDTVTVTRAADAIVEVTNYLTHLVILDVNLPDMNGFALFKELRARRYLGPVIFLTGHGDIPTSVRAMRAGAVDFLTKPVRRETLMGAIDSALSRDRTQRVAAEQRRVLRERYERRTARERQVFARVTESKLNKQIAAELGTSERTIKAHRAQVMDKMCAESIAELVRDADVLRGSTSTASN